MPWAFRFHEDIIPTTQEKRLLSQEALSPSEKTLLSKVVKSLETSVTVSFQTSQGKRYLLEVVPSGMAQGQV